MEPLRADLSDNSKLGGGGRRELNPEAIATSLVYIDVRSGDEFERHDLGPDKAVSLRHPDVAGDGTVIAGRLRQKAGGEADALIYRHRRQQPLEACLLPQDLGRSLASYVSSVAFDASGRFAAVTSSRGRLVVAIDIASRRVVTTTGLNDLSGIAAARETASFIATGCRGSLVSVSRWGRPVTPLGAARWSWDNHVAAVGA
jgi:hypothetical protein